MRVWQALPGPPLTSEAERVRDVWTLFVLLAAAVGLLVVVLVLFAVRVHVWQRVGFVSELLATKNFVYWALMHIIMSFGTPR